MALLTRAAARLPAHLILAEPGPHKVRAGGKKLLQGSLVLCEGKEEVVFRPLLAWLKVERALVVLKQLFLVLKLRSDDGHE